MGTLPLEVLVELEVGASLDEVVPPQVQVLQRLPPRLAVVVADDEGLRALRGRPDVRAVFAEEVPPDELERLDQVGRAFAAAWNERRRPKERRGEGLPWDAPGFEPPG